ncbi:hypothetical protein [Virgibacillus ndiopensis]|uniref:hypothetical protein n=1 Tax=Virgibacillus ndiopensis TaxID=2004408 RepID=UPI000C08A78E|nr:hypothetical protein [Virgibacillus ndiopensis]
MKIRISVLMLVLMFLISSKVEMKAAVMEHGSEEVGQQHNWEKSSTNYDRIHTGSHEYTYWKNFMRETRTCDISIKIKTVVYYCDLHDHTKSTTHLEETIHSGRHK